MYLFSRPQSEFVIRGLQQIAVQKARLRRLDGKRTLARRLGATKDSMNTPAHELDEAHAGPRHSARPERSEDETLGSLTGGDVNCSSKIRKQRQSERAAAETVHDRDVASRTQRANGKRYWEFNSTIAREGPRTSDANNRPDHIKTPSKRTKIAIQQLIRWPSTSTLKEAIGKNQIINCTRRIHLRTTDTYHTRQGHQKEAISS